MATPERLGGRGRSRIARVGLRVALVGSVLLGALSAPSGPLVFAGDDVAPGSVAPGSAALAARLLEAADTRMKAKLEEARLLEAAGRRDAALAALAEVDKIYERALEVVRPLLAGTTHPVIRLAPAVPVPPPDALARPRPSAPRLPPEPAPVVLAPKADPVPSAVAYLLRCQTDDGLFHVSVGRAPGDPETDPAHDARATAMAVLSILDAAPETLPTDLSANLRRSMVRAGTALAARADARGALDPDLESHAYALWALAAAYGDFGVAEWKPVLQAALGYALTSRDTRGQWSVPGGAADSLRTTLTMLAALHECLPLTDAAGRTDEIRVAIEQARISPPSSPPGDEGAEIAVQLIQGTGPSEVSWIADVARRSSSGRAPFPAPALRVPPLRPFVLLWGTVLARARWGGIEASEFARWWNEVLVPAMDLQETATAPAAGSWSGGTGPAASSRLEVTALCLLAWKVPTAEFAEPTAR